MRYLIIFLTCLSAWAETQLCTATWNGSLMGFRYRIRQTDAWDTSDVSTWPMLTNDINALTLTFYCDPTKQQAVRRFMTTPPFTEDGLDVAPVSLAFTAGATYFVDNGRSLNGSGTQDSPWKAFGDISWANVTAATATGDCVIVFAARSAWPANGDITIGGSGKPTGNVVLYGGRQYQTNSTGVAYWLDESNTNKAVFGSSGSGFLVNAGVSNVILDSFRITNSAFGGVNLGTANPTTLIKNIQVRRMDVISPAANHGIWAGYMEGSCSNIIISGNFVTNTPLEGIYLGHSTYLPSTITGCIIEGNTLVDTGLSVQGDIDVKPGASGCIVRSNVLYRTVSTGSTCGAVIAAPNCTVIGNTFRNTAQDGGLDWGYGIYVNGEGDAAGNGMTVTNTLIKWNYLLSNPGAGLKLLATAANGSVSAQVLQNVFGDNATGIILSSSGGRPVSMEICGNVFERNLPNGNIVNSGGTITTNVACLPVDKPVAISGFNIIRGGVVIK